MLAENLKEKLEPVIDFRIKRNAHKTYPLAFKRIEAPCTDMEKIYLPRTFPFPEEFLVDTVRHEADHIREMKGFSKALSGVEDPKEGMRHVEEFFVKSDFGENPALAFEIFNIVEDSRIDTAARKELLGSARIFKKERPILLKKRPTTILKNKFDKFREFFLQKALLGVTAKKPPKEFEKLLDECVGYVKEVHGKDIPASLEAVAKIYRVFKENFNIKQKMFKLPPLGRRGKMKGFRIPRGGPGYTDKSEPEKDSDSEKKKSKKGAGKGKKDKKRKKAKKEEAKKKKKEKKDSKDKARGDDRERKSVPFKNDWMSTDDKQILTPKLLGMDSDGKIENMIEKYAGEIEGMRRALRFLKRESMTQKMARAGEEIEIEDYFQQELEKKATGVRPDDPIFLADEREKRDPCWAVLADVSGSTPDILDEIKATLIILGETLKRSNFYFGIYAFHSEGGWDSQEQRDILHRLKEFDERYISLKVLSKIMALRAKGGTKMADSITYLAERLGKNPYRPKVLTIVSDGEPNFIPPVKRALEEARKNGVVSFFCVIGEEHESSIKQVVQKYILIKREELFKLPKEILRIMKLFHIGGN